MDGLLIKFFGNAKLSSYKISLGADASMSHPTREFCKCTFIRIFALIGNNKLGYFSKIKKSYGFKGISFLRPRQYVLVALVRTGPFWREFESN